MNNFFKINVAMAFLLSTSLCWAEPQTQRPANQQNLKIRSNSQPSLQKLKPISPFSLQKSADGGRDTGGGGNASKSKEQDVLEATRGLKKSLRELFTKIENIAMVYKDSKEAWLPLELSDLVEDGKIQSFIDIVEFSPIYGDCFDPITKQPRDSSISPEGVMCLSLTRLTRIPKSALNLELAALGAHEISHLRQYNEDKAEFVQSQILKFSEIFFAFEPLNGFPASLISGKTSKFVDSNDFTKRKFLVEYSKQEIVFKNNQKCILRNNDIIQLATYNSSLDGWVSSYAKITQVNPDGSIQATYFEGSTIVSQNAFVRCETP